MNWVRLAVILLIIAVAIPVTESASNQDSPAVAAARQLFGDYQVIPGERIGSVKLGETTVEDFVRFYGLTNTYGLRPNPEPVWEFPDPKIAIGPGVTMAWDQPFAFLFCQSNRRLVATSVFNVRSLYPDHQLFWLFMQRLATPEGATGKQPFSQWISGYGKPLTINTKMPR